MKLPPYKKTPANYHCYYRVSDKGYEKQKLNKTKIDCLNNYINHFGKDSLTVICDNCLDSTIVIINKMVDRVLTTNLGNAGSINYAFTLAMKEQSDNTVCYFLEDDYLHTNNAAKALIDGFLLGADYVSLYDCPDKYSHHPTPNPLITDGGEDTKVFVGNVSHWKITNSTTMTFACKASTLKEDYLTWRKYIINNHPKDFDAWLDLRGQGKCLITPLPSYSTHIEHNWIAPLISW